MLAKIAGEGGVEYQVLEGRYGPYVQIGEDPPRGSKEKPRRSSLWDGMSMDTLTLDDALMLLSFPKTLGKHPESGEDVTVQDGPNGPYVRAGKDSRSLEGGRQRGVAILAFFAREGGFPADGEQRARFPALIALLGSVGLLSADEVKQLAHTAEPPVRNSVGATVGRIAACGFANE